VLPRNHRELLQCVNFVVSDGECSQLALREIEGECQYLMAFSRPSVQTSWLPLRL
jgi:hypothetical protein